MDVSSLYPLGSPEEILPGEIRRCLDRFQFFYGGDPVPEVQVRFDLEDLDESFLTTILFDCHPLVVHLPAGLEDQKLLSSVFKRLFSFCASICRDWYKHVGWWPEISETKSVADMVSEVFPCGWLTDCPHVVYVCSCPKLRLIQMTEHNQRKANPKVELCLFCRQPVIYGWDQPDGRPRYTNRQASRKAALQVVWAAETGL